MSKLNQLQTKRNDLANRIKSHAEKQDTWGAEGKRVWDELNAEYDRVFADLQKARGQHEVDERLQLINQMNQPHGGRPRFGRDNGWNGSRGQRIDGTGEQPLIDRAVTGWALAQLGHSVTREMVEACDEYGLSINSPTFHIDFGTHGPMTWARRQREFYNALGAQDGTSGGYTVPQGFMARLEKAMVDFSSVLGVCEIMRTSDGRPMPWPTTDDTSNSGVQIGENTQVSEQDIAFGNVTFGAYKFSSNLVRVASELLRDTGIQNFAGELGALLGERLGRILGARFTTGTGAGTIHGIVTRSALGKTATSATAISMDDLIDLIASVDNAYLNETTGWMFHQLIAAAIQKLKDGNGQYLWQPPVQLGQPPMLLGFPVLGINNHMASTVASGNKTVLFGDFAKYKARLVGEQRTKRLVERYADYDQEGFISFQEADGNLIQTAAVKHMIH